MITDQKSQQLEHGLRFEIVEESSNIQPNLFRYVSFSRIFSSKFKIIICFGLTIISIFSLPKRQIKNVITTTDNSNDKFFKIDQETGYLSLLKKLNIRHKYLLKIQVTDNFGLTAETKIEASVEDVNDHAPVFAKVICNFHEILIHADLI